MKETTYTDLIEAAVTQGANIKTILADIETLRRLKTAVNAYKSNLRARTAKELQECE